MWKGIRYLTVICLMGALLLSIACDGDNEETVVPTGNGGEELVITVGNITDLTGVAAEGMGPIKKALDDMIGYYNDNNIIPGVRIELITYDDQYDPARQVPGYKKLRSDGADFIWTSSPLAVPILLPQLNSDKYVMFTATSNIPINELEGGYIFSLGIDQKAEAYTLLDWIAENDPDFPTDRPAKVGAAAWSDSISNVLFGHAEDYVDAHPEQYEWDATFLTEFKFNWAVESEELKDCDYVFVPAPPQVFMRDFRKAGGTAKFLGTDVHAAFFREITDMGLWDEAAGSLFIRTSRWYNETGLIVDIINQLIDGNHSVAEAEAIRRQGSGYIAAKQCYLMLDIVRATVENVGAGNFSSEALYNTATNWEFELDGVPDFNSFTKTKRISQNYYAVYEVDSEK